MFFQADSEVFLVHPCTIKVKGNILHSDTKTHVVICQAKLLMKSDIGNMFPD